MSYEVSEVAAPVTAQTQPSMREERTVEPYKSRQIKAKESNAYAQVDTNDVKTPLEEGKTAPEESVTLSPGAAALVRKEQAFRKAQQEHKAKEEALEIERQEIADMKALKAKLAAKDFSGIESQVPYEDYTNYLIEKGAGQTPEGEALKKISAKLEEIEKNQKDDVSKRFEAAVQERRKAVKTLVDAEGSAFTRIKKAKAEEAVVQHILDTWEHESLELSPDEAAKEVEELLKEKANKWAELAEPKAETEEPKVAKPSGADIIKELPLKPKGVTLTNNMTPVGDQKAPKKSFQGMTDSERWAEARRRAEEKIKLRG